MAFNPLRMLMPKHHSVGYKTTGLAFCGSKSIKSNPFALPIRPCKTRSSLINLDRGNISLTQ
jgi:hypothetical protein